MTTEIISGTNSTDYAAIEKWLVNLWEELLEMPEIVAESDFFDLGADSLTVIRLIHRIEQRFGKNILCLDDLFANSQLRQIATAIDVSLR